MIHAILEINIKVYVFYYANIIFAHFVMVGGKH